MSDDEPYSILDADWFEPEETEKVKLPQSRRYLRAARWGFNTLLQNHYSDTAYVFHIIGVLAALRAVQHSLNEHDRTLSPDHEKVIAAWWKETRDIKHYPDLEFIKTARDKMLKRGSFGSYAINRESSIGEGANRTVTKTEYELVYYDDDGERRDLGKALASAIDWCGRELDHIEAQISR